MNLLKNKLLLEYSHLNPKECFIRETYRDIYYVFITQNVFIVIIGDNGEYEFIEIHKNMQNNMTTIDEFSNFAKKHNSNNDGGENLLYELNAIDATGRYIKEYADVNHVMSLLRTHINNAIL